MQFLELVSSDTMLACVADFKDMQKAGISVYAFDAHSFGRSEPLDAKLRAYVSSVDHLIDDVYSFLQVCTTFIAQYTCAL